MAIDTAYTLLNSGFNELILFNVEWIISITVTFLSMLIVTRDVQKWKTLAFPIMLGWHICGLSPFFFAYLISAIVFAIEGISLSALGQVFSTASIRVARTFEKFVGETEWGRERKLKRKLERDEASILRKALKKVRRKSAEGEWIMDLGTGKRIKTAGKSEKELKALLKDIEVGKARRIPKLAIKRESIIKQLPKVELTPFDYGKMEARRERRRLAKKEAMERMSFYTTGKAYTKDLEKNLRTKKTRKTRRMKKHKRDRYYY